MSRGDSAARNLLELNPNERPSIAKLKDGRFALSFKHASVAISARFANYLIQSGRALRVEEEEPKKTSG